MFSVEFKKNPFCPDFGIGIVFIQTNLIVMEIKVKENGNILSKQNPIVSRDEWIVARKQLLVKEKELTRLSDQLSAKRRELPWVRVDKTYIFDGPDGRVSLADLFEGRSQLIVQHFMMGPGWKEGCVGCSFTADHVEAALQHLPHHDVSFVAISRAPIAEIESFKKRMGWKFRWVSSFESDFNYDYHLQAGSPGINFGTDGKDVGMWGGTVPVNLGFEPPVPRIYDLKVNNATVPAGGTIQLTIKATKAQ
jgi:hypothetical protein